MDVNKICPGCMKELESSEGVNICPHCGYNLKDMAAASHQLQPFAILAGKYLVGRVIGEGGFGITYIGYDLNEDKTVAIKEYAKARLCTGGTVQKPWEAGAMDGCVCALRHNL